MWCVITILFVSLKCRGQRKEMTLDVMLITDPIESLKLWVIPSGVYVCRATPSNLCFSSAVTSPLCRQGRFCVVSVQDRKMLLMKEFLNSSEECCVQLSFSSEAGVSLAIAGVCSVDPHPSQLLLVSSAAEIPLSNCV